MAQGWIGKKLPRLRISHYHITDLRSFMGLTNQFSSYAPDLKHAMVPLQSLLKKSRVYQWMPEHQEAFQKIKDLLT